MHSLFIAGRCEKQFIKCRFVIQKGKLCATASCENRETNVILVHRCATAPLESDPPEL